MKNYTSVTKSGSYITFSGDDSLVLKDTVLQVAKYRSEDGYVYIDYMVNSKPDEVKLVASNVTAPVNTGGDNLMALLITMAGLPSEATNPTIIVGTPVNAVAATALLTHNGAIVPASHAETVLTSSGTETADGSTVTIGDITYRFKTTMSQINDVKRNGTAATTLANLKAAINHTGTDGVEYYAGTVANPKVIGTTINTTTLKIQARVIGSTPNTYPTTVSSATLSFPAVTLGAGTGASVAGITTANALVTIGTTTYTIVNVLTETITTVAVPNQVLYGGSTAIALDNLKVAVNLGATIGTNYSTGTVINPYMTATTNTDTTQLFVAKIKGEVGNSIVTTDTLGTFAHATATGGVNGTVGSINTIYQSGNTMYTTLANTVNGANWNQTPTLSSSQTSLKYKAYLVGFTGGPITAVPLNQNDVDYLGDLTWVISTAGIYRADTTGFNLLQNKTFLSISGFHRYNNVNISLDDVYNIITISTYDYDTQQAGDFGGSYYVSIELFG